MGYINFSSPVSRRLIKGAGGHGFAQLATIFQRLVEIPLFLYFWDTQLYGEWLILAVIPAYLSLSDLGIVGVANRELAIVVGQNDRKQGQTVFQSGWVIITMLSVVILGVYCVITSLHPIGDYIVHWFDFISITSSTVDMVILVLIVYVLLGLQILLIHGAFACEGHNGESAFLQGISIWLELGLLVLVLLNGGGPVEAAGAYLFGRLLSFTIMLFRLRKRNNWVRFGISDASILKIKEMIPLTVAGLAFPLGNAMNIQGLLLVVGALLGPLAVVVFSTLRTLTRTAISMVYLVNRTIQPELGRAFGSGNNELLKKIYRLACRTSFWVSIVICVFLLFSGDVILSMWTHDKVQMDWLLFSLLLGSTLFNALWNTSFQIAYATNQYKSIAAGYLILYGIVAVALGYILALSFDLDGIASSILIVDFLMVIYINHTAFSLADERLGKWILNISKPPGLSLLLAKVKYLYIGLK